MRPGCVTWTIVPGPPQCALSDPVTGEPGVRLEFRAEDGTLVAAEHRGATMFTWWDGLPGGVGQGGRGTVTLRARYRPPPGRAARRRRRRSGRLTLTVDGTEAARGHHGPARRPGGGHGAAGRVRATVHLTAGREAEIAVCLRPDDWPQGPVAIRLGVAAAPDDDALLAEAVEAARAADAAVVVVGSGAGHRERGVRPPTAWRCRAGRTNSSGGWRR